MKQGQTLNILPLTFHQRLQCLAYLHQAGELEEIHLPSPASMVKSLHSLHRLAPCTNNFEHLKLWGFLPVQAMESHILCQTDGARS